MKEFKHRIEKILSYFYWLYSKLRQHIGFLQKNKENLRTPEEKAIIAFFIFFFSLLNIMGFILIMVVHKDVKNIRILPTFISFLVFQATFMLLGITSESDTSITASLLYSIIISVVTYYFLIIYPIWLSVITLIIYGIILIEMTSFQLWAIFSLAVYSIIIIIVTLSKVQII